MSNKKKRGETRVVGVTARTYEAKLADRIIRKLNARNKFLLYTDWTFHIKLRDALLDVVSDPPGTVDIGMEALRAIYDACQGKVWGVPKDSWCSAVVREPPEELFSAPTFPIFQDQYNKFLAWLSSLRELPSGHEIFKIQSYSVQRCSAVGELLGEPFVVLPGDLEEASRWRRFTPKRRIQVTSKTHGRCMFLSASKEPDFKIVYAYVHSTPLAEIRAFGVWHVVVAYQYATHVSLTTESLAETVGSFLQAFQTKSVHKPYGHAPLAHRAALRAIGLRGASSAAAVGAVTPATVVGAPLP